MIKELWEANKKAIKDASLDLLRLVVLALIPLLIDRVAGLDLPVEVIVAITISLKWLDKYLHKYGKENDVEELIKGITRF
jgi:hypothetical protein